VARSLGTISHGIQSGPGWITSHLAGKTVEWFGIDGTWLIIRFTDGHEARLGWQDVHGNQLKGEPFLENLDVKIQIVGASLSGEASTG
jgi:hypothetical protein